MTSEPVTATNPARTQGCLPKRQAGLSVVALLLGFMSSSQLDAFQGDTLSLPTLTLDQMREDIRQLREVAKRAWAYAEDKHELLGVDLDKLHDDMIRRLPAVKSADAFFDLTREFVASMMEGHARVHAPWRAGVTLDNRRWPFSLTRIDKRFIIDKVSSAEEAVELGDELKAVDGRRIETIYEQRLRTTSASTSASQRYWVLKYLPLTTEQSVRVTIRRPDGTEKILELKTLPLTAAKPGSPPVEWRVLDSGFGYLRLSSFAQDSRIWENSDKTPRALRKALAPKTKALKKAFGALKGTRGLILDVRDNAGGSDLLGHYLAQFLCDVEKSPVYYTLETRASEELLKLPEYEALRGLPRHQLQSKAPVRVERDASVKRYTGRVVVLMNEGCFSATDCFLNYIASAAPDIALVGRPNGAGAGAPRKMATLTYSGIEVTFCIMRVWSPNGTLVEGRPLTPTVLVSPTREDVMRKRDVDLEAAQRWLRQSLKK